MNSGNKIKAMISGYAAKLGFTTQKTSVQAQKIDALPLETYGIVLDRFSI